MLSFMYYKQMVEHLADNGRTVICHINLKLKRGHRYNMSVPFSELRHILDNDMDLFEYRKDRIQFKNTVGKQYAYTIDDLMFFHVSKVEIRNPQTETSLIFRDFKEMTTHMQSHGKQVVVVVSIWTHNSERMIYRVSLKQMEHNLNDCLRIVYDPNGVLAFTSLDGERHSYPYHELRIAVVDTIQII